MVENTSTAKPNAGKSSSMSGGRLTSKLLRITGISLISIVLLSVLSLIAITMAVQTETGTRTLWRLATGILPGKLGISALSGDLVSGSISSGLNVRNVHYQDASRDIRLDKLSSRWQLSLSPLRLTVHTLQLGKLQAVLQATPPEPLLLPDQIKLPLQVQLKRATLASLTIQQQASKQLDIKQLDTKQEPTEYAFKDIALHASLNDPLVDNSLAVKGADNKASLNKATDNKAIDNKVQHTLVLEHAVTPVGEAAVTLQLNGDRPFALAGSAQLRNGNLLNNTSKKNAIKAKQEDESYAINAKLAGTLEQLSLTADIRGSKLAGTLAVAATPFDPIPFTQAMLDIQHVNLAAFSASAPRSDIKLQAKLLPVASTDPAQLRVSGPIVITNSLAGPWDKGLLPVASISTKAALDAQTQTLSDLVIKLAGGGQLAGRAHNRSPLAGELSMQASRLNLAALHGAMKPTGLSGPLSLKFAADTQTLQLSLADRLFSIHAEASLDADTIILKQAVLQAGTAKLMASGQLARDETSSYGLKVELSNFNPSLFMDTMQLSANKARANNKISNKTASASTPIVANINSHIELNGRLKPALLAQARFDINNSSYANMPMSGGGMLQLAGQHLLNSDVQLSVAGNQLHIKGAFGAVGDKLYATIDAPALDRLGLGLAGQLKLDGDFAGTLQQPVVNAVYSASKLGFGVHQLDQAQGALHMQGLPGMQAKANGQNTRPADNKLSFELNARGYHSDIADLNTLTASISGSYARHELHLATTGKVKEQRLDLTVAASGRLQQAEAGMTWSGMLSQLDNRSRPQLHLSQAVSITAGPQLLIIDATNIKIEQAQLTLKHLDYNAGAISSEGAITGFNLADMLALKKELTGLDTPIKTDLELGASWNFRLAEQGRGYIEVARTRGDIGMKVADTDGLGNSYDAKPIMLGLDALRIRADFQGNALNIQSVTNASRFGSLQGQASVGMQAQDNDKDKLKDRLLTINAASAVSGHLQLSIPQLQTLAALAGPSVLLNGTVNAKLAVQGTVGEPILSGQLDGDKLALTLYDQGIKLRDGIVRIALRNNVVEMQKVEFHGGQGLLRIVGSIPLNSDATSNELAATIIADKLQLLADPSSQLTLSGQAKISSNIANSSGNAAGGKLAIVGKFTVDSALFSLPESSAPELGDDVLILRGDVRGDTGATATGAANTAKPANSKKALATKQASPYSPEIHLDLDLGRDFRFSGQGAELLLAGLVRIDSLPQQSPQANGTVRVTQGTFEAFGAKLAIERGIINFQGPLDNPNINILAMRRKQEVAAGVQVSGTADRPRVTMVSEPDVPNEQKLSWLVFGRASNSNGQGQAAAQGAALALVSKLGGGKGLASKIGLDEISLGTNASGQQLLSLGKTISDKLSVGYKQGLTSVDSAVELTYLLSQHWSVVTSGGRMMGLNIFYSNRFDKIFGDKIFGTQGKEKAPAVQPAATEKLTN